MGCTLGEDSKFAAAVVATELRPGTEDLNRTQTQFNNGKITRLDTVVTDLDVERGSWSVLIREMAVAEKVNAAALMIPEIGQPHRVLLERRTVSTL